MHICKSGASPFITHHKSEKMGENGGNGGILSPGFLGTAGLCMVRAPWQICLSATSKGLRVGVH